MVPFEVPILDSLEKLSFSALCGKVHKSTKPAKSPLVNFCNNLLVSKSAIYLRASVLAQSDFHGIVIIFFCF